MPFQQLLPSAARTSSQTTDKLGRLHGPMLPPQLTAVLDVTAVPGTDTVTLVIEEFNPSTGGFNEVFRCAARAEIGKDVLHVAPGVPIARPAADAGTLLHSANHPVAQYRLRVEHSDEGEFTYSLYCTD